MAIRGDGIRYILGEGNDLTVTSPTYRNGTMVNESRFYQGMPKNVRQ
jgi:hypothetical protein